VDIKDLGKKNNENYDKSIYTTGMDYFRHMTVFEQLTITLKLEELKLLAPRPKTETDWVIPHLKSLIREQGITINSLKRLLKDNNIIVEEG